MSNLVVQIGYSTKGGGLVPVAASRDPSLTRFVANQILDELSSSEFEDDTLTKLAQAEHKHVESLFETLGVNDDDEG